MSTRLLLRGKKNLSAFDQELPFSSNHVVQEKSRKRSSHTTLNRRRWWMAITFSDMKMTLILCATLWVSRLLRKFLSLFIVSNTFCIHSMSEPYSNVGTSFRRNHCSFSFRDRKRTLTRNRENTPKVETARKDRAWKWWNTYHTRTNITSLTPCWAISLQWSIDMTASDAFARFHDF